MKRVFVHRNLNRPPYFSIKESGGCSGGLLIDHYTTVYLKDVKFLVSEKGNEDVRIHGKDKGVHAGVEGIMQGYLNHFEIEPTEWRLVDYNPRGGDKTFVFFDTGLPVYEAEEAILYNTREVWIK